MQWLRPHVPDAGVDRLLVCPGIHGVLTAPFSLLARPGELICVESLTYPGVKAIAAQLGVQLHALQLDDDGPIADAFEHACKTLKPSAVLQPDAAEPDHPDRLARGARRWPMWRCATPCRSSRMTPTACCRARCRPRWPRWHRR